MRTIRIGAGAGMETDRLKPAIELLRHGQLDYLSFECMAERTTALAQQRKIDNPQEGYNRLLQYRMEQILPLAYKNKVKIISNMGNANIPRAMEISAEIAERHGLKGMKIAGVIGDSIIENIDTYYDYPLFEKPDRTLADYKDSIVSANVYLGFEGIVEALANGADVIITGRCTDPALFMAPAVHEFGWSTDDELATGTLLGHMLECGCQVSGGYYASPGKIDVPDIWNLGFPIAEVSENGDIVLIKLEGTGGVINTATCTQQLLYEIHNPAAYLTADSVADFSGVTFTEVGKDKVLARGAKGKPRPPTLKVSVGYKDSYIAAMEIAYGGPGCYERAQEAIAIVETRIDKLGYRPHIEEWRADFLGINSIFAPKQKDPHTGYPEMRVRMMARVVDKAMAQEILLECGSLVANGPAAGGAAVNSVKDVVNIMSILVPREDIPVSVQYREV